MRTNLVNRLLPAGFIFILQEYLEFAISLCAAKQPEEIIRELMQRHAIAQEVDGADEKIMAWRRRVRCVRCR